MRQTNKLSYVDTEEIDDQREFRQSKRLNTENIREHEEEFRTVYNNQTDSVTMASKDYDKNQMEETEEDYSFVLTKSGR